jgi:ankyrin repeat protein
MKTFFGLAPLAMAAINGDLQIAVELIKKNAKIDVKTFFGFTPLDFARYHENHEMVELLEKFEAYSKADVGMSG